MALTLGANVDTEALAKSFASKGVVDMPGFLADDAARILVENLETRRDWLEVFHTSASTYEMPVSEFDRMDSAKRSQLDQLVWREARSGFQFRYRTVRVPDARSKRTPLEDPLHEFTVMMSSTPILAMFGKVTGRDTLHLADAQATAYSAGHFLTAHDDAVEKKGRVAAYVFSLAREWSPDWGGLLIFPEAAELRGFIPEFNSLRLFSVPQKHSVTYVPPFVTATRYSITGWLRLKDVE